MELIQILTSNLGVEENQATGGAGLLFQLAKEKLGDEVFAQVAEHVPGIGNMIEAAPASGGLASAIGGLASMMGAPEELGSIASAIAGFSQLGLNSDMVSQFIPIILSFVQEKGGDQVSGLLAQVLDAQ
jgi:Protein of unknown function VcgC/VcgE (DUF2780)